ncbi:MAG: aspartate-semialdehyde dehydrogenase [Candidatus Margulisbacteria bacterium]|nr:aspartate-semialdehyde dehydrogenase [Candidatus Margulisiibacteriota bacterium]
MQGYNVAVVGATGVVGTEIIKVLEEMNFPIKTLIPLASERSAGSRIEFKGENVKVQLLTKESFKGVQIALFSAGGSISEKYAPIAVASGAVVIDNTSFFRMDPNVPLVVPEVNAHDIRKHQGIIANPNCSTSQMVLAMLPIHEHFKIKRVVVSTYQATSGAGKDAMDEMLNQTISIVNGNGPTKPKKFTKQIAFNVIPHIDSFLENGFTKEEMKMTNETKKIFGDDSIEVVANCVRVPVFIGHSEAMNIETEKPFDIEKVRELIAKVPNVKVMDDLANNVYPTPSDSVETNDTLIGRIRRDFSVPNGIALFCVSNNLRKGAAFNAVQIAFELVQQELI